MIKNVLFLIFIYFLNCIASEPEIQIISQTSNSLQVKISFSEPRIVKIDRDVSGQQRSYLFMEGLALLEEEGYPRVPYLTKMFSLPTQKVSYHILDVKTEHISVVNYLLNEPVTKNSGSQDPQIIKNKETINIASHGLFRYVPLFNLTVFPVSIDQTGKGAEVIRSMTIEMTSATSTEKTQLKTGRYAAKEKSVFKNLLLNGDQVTYQVDQPLSQTTSTNQRYRSNRYKLLVDQTGIYKITYSDLTAAGVAPGMFDTRKLRLTNRGQEIPIYFKGGEDGVFDPGDYFEFWGKKNEKTFITKYPDVYSDPFTEVNVYWLGEAESSGLRMTEESGALTVTDVSKYIVPFSFTEKIHYEQNNTFHRFGNVNIDSLSYTMDHWFYDRGVTAVGSRTYQAMIPWPYLQLSTRSVFVKAMMRGLSIESESNPLDNHQVEIWLNDRLVAGTDSPWENQDAHLLTNEGSTGLSQADIFNGDNQFRIVMDQTGVTDIALLNWFEISYQRRYRAYQNELKFQKQDNLPENYVLQFEIDGFNTPDISLYKLGISKIVNNRINYINADDNYNSYQIAFQDEIFYPDIEYVALTENKKKKPLEIVADNPWISDNEQSSLFDATNSADYLIITDDLFYNNCLELKSYREGFGLKVEVVRVQDIYDEFNFGIKSPLAIKDFLKYVFQNWDPAHRLLYVNLVGDANYDYKNGDLVPTFLFETEKYGAAASDFQYALVSGRDNTPDLIIGRMPVSTNSEFEAYFDKLKAYEDPVNIGEWRNRGLFISGNDASTLEFTGLPMFRTQNQRLINMEEPAGFFTRKLNTVEDESIPGGDPNFGSTPTLIDYFDDGVALINFLGHGGGGIWADVGLFNSNDIERLNNGPRLPFIKSMTCFTGAFESPSINGIGEQLIVTPEKGAIGVLAASGVGWAYNDFAVGWTLTEFLLKEELTAGEAILFTKIFYLNNNVYVTELFDNTIPSYYSLKLSMVNHYNLLGDPFVTITIPKNTLKVTVDNTIPVIGDTVHITIDTPFPSGNGRVELCNENHEPLAEKFLVFNNAQAETDFAIPQELENQLAYVKAYAINSAGDQDGRGVANLAINKTLLDSIVVSPKNPSVGDELFFSAYITSPIALQQVKIKNLKGPTGQYSMIDLNRVNDSLWTSGSGFGPYLFADTLYYDLQMDDISGNSYLRRRNKLIINDPRPDFWITGQGLSFGGTEQIQLTATVENISDSSYSEIPFELFVDSVNPDQEPFYTEEITLNAHQKKNISVIIDQELIIPERLFIAVIDRENRIEERNEENNTQNIKFPVNLFNVPQTVGTTLDGANNDTLSLDQFARFHLPSQGLSASSVFSYRLNPQMGIQSLNDQPGLAYVNFDGTADPISMSLKYENPAASQLQEAFLEFSVDTTLYDELTLQNISICRFVSSLNRWVAVNTVHHGNKILTSVTLPGEYALFKIEDVKKPVIEITINGRILHDNMLVPANPSLAFILQDENGIDLTTGFNVYIDDQKLSEEELNIPDSVQNANSVALIAKPKLSSGDHTIVAEASDAFGNTLEKSLVFKVSAGFDLKIYGNYPNPFEDFTIISFLILANNVLDDFSMKIYTVAGRQIREIKNPQGSDEIWDPGYHEVEWDGRDEDGALVANGVYFAIIRAKLASQSFEKTLKIAKLR